MADDDRSGAGDHLVAGLTRWLASARVDAAAAARAREHWLRRLAGEEARFAGVLLDLAERRGPVVVHLAGGLRWTGRVTAVADEFLALGLKDGAGALVTPAGTCSVRAADDRGTAGDRAGALDMTFAEALLAMASDRPRVAVLAAGERVAGELRGVGADVLTLVDGTGRCYVPLASVHAVRLA